MPKEAERFNRKLVRQALKLWRRVAALGAHPLARLGIVAAERNVLGQPATAVGRGLALRAVLQRAINHLRPDNTAPDWTEKRWRPFLILNTQYLEAKSPDLLADRLNVARSTYNHAQADALDALAALLREWEEQHLAAERPLKPETTVPFLAPPRPPQKLVGRDGVLKALKQQILAGSGQALVGIPGVGKTALALALAYDAEVLNHFTDGVLWARLGRQANVAEALQNWARIVGMTPEQTKKHSTTTALAEAIHEVIALRRMLLVIDDAWTAEAALAFRIGGPHCAHLLTTRLPPVAAYFAGPHVVTVPELSVEDGRALLGQFAPQIIAAEAAPARQLVHRVGGLPLALTLIGSYLQIHHNPNAHPDEAGALLSRLQQIEQRLSLTQPQSPAGRHPSLSTAAPLSLTAVFSVSIEALPDDARRALPALALLPPKPNTFSKAAAVAVTQETADIIDTLVSSGLVEEQEQDRLALHQAIADFARLQLHDPAAYGRLITYFVIFTQQNETDFDALSLESANIWAALQLAREQQEWDALAQGANAFCRYLLVRGQYQQAENAAGWALEAAKNQEDLPAEATALMHLGRSALNRGQYETAEAHFVEGLGRARKTNDAESISRLLQGLGVVFDHRGQYEKAETLYKESLASARRANNLQRVSTLLMNLGGLAFDLGRTEEAETRLLEALAIAQEIGQEDIMSPLLLNLGVVAGSRGEYSREEAFYRDALKIARRQGHREDITYLLTNLGSLALDRGDFAAAEAYLTEGIEIARKDDHRERLSALMRHLGELMILRKGYQRAEEILREGLALARKTGHRKNTAALLAHLGTLYTSRGEFPQAEAAATESLALAREIGHAWYVSNALKILGELHLAKGNRQQAATLFQHAFDEASAVEDKGLMALTMFGLARAHVELNGSVARQHGQRSLEILSAINHRERWQVQKWLKGIPQEHQC